jgi:hypothetical protein
MSAQLTAQVTRMLAALAVCAAGPLRAQDAAPPRTPAERAPQRTVDDVQAACKKLLQAPHAFTGTCRFGAPPAGGTPPTSVPFRGAWQQDVLLYCIRDQSVLEHGERQLVRVHERAWTLPQGDSPDCPLSPRAIATHLPQATLHRVEPTSHADRPALRVHAVWSGKAAAALIEQTAVPDARSQSILERLPLLAARVGDRMVVDAAVCFDPATRTLYATTLRIALLDHPDAPEDAEAAPAPDGLPPHAKVALLEYVFELTVHEPDRVPMPPLDAGVRERLGLPPR